MGDIVSFTDKALHTRTGTIVRLNQKTATITCAETEGHWRVSIRLATAGGGNGTNVDARQIPRATTEKSFSAERHPFGPGIENV